MDRSSERFDVVILDPPAFAKSKAHFEPARRGYKEVNLRGLKLLHPGGFLVTCSCSHHMPADEFYRLVLEAANDARRPLRLVESRAGQRPPHSRRRARVGVSQVPHLSSAGVEFGKCLHPKETTETRLEA